MTSLYGSVNGCPKFCIGCNKPFSIRDGQPEPQRHLYCHAMTPACVVLAVKPVVARRAV